MLQPVIAKFRQYCARGYSARKQNDSINFPARPPAKGSQTGVSLVDLAEPAFDHKAIVCEEEAISR